MTHAQHITNLLNRIPVHIEGDNIVAIDPRTVTGLTVVENKDQPNFYVIHTNFDLHYHTRDEVAIRDICSLVPFQMISRTTETARA